MEKKQGQSVGPQVELLDRAPSGQLPDLRGVDFRVPAVQVQVPLGHAGLLREARLAPDALDEPVPWSFLPIDQDRVHVGDVVLVGRQLTGQEVHLLVRGQTDDRTRVFQTRLVQDRALERVAHDGRHAEPPGVGHVDRIGVDEERLEAVLSKQRGEGSAERVRSHHDDVTARCRGHFEKPRHRCRGDALHHHGDRDRQEHERHQRLTVLRAKPGAGHGRRAARQQDRDERGHRDRHDTAGTDPHDE